MTKTATVPDAKVEAPKFGRDRYSPGMYRLDLSSVKDAPLMLNGKPSTFEAVYTKLADSKLTEVVSRFTFGTAKYVNAEGELVVAFEHWAVLSSMNTLAELLYRGVNPYEAMWFYYDHDWSRDADECHVFFVAHADKVILEHCHFSSEEPLILKLEKDDEPIWHTHPYFDEALICYWYQKFYSETMTGKLMMLRPDEPTLYYFQRPTSRDVQKDSVDALKLVTLVKMYRLLWVAVALLVGIAFREFREIMGVVAIVLLLDVLWRAWATRKVGITD